METSDCLLNFEGLACLAIHLAFHQGEHCPAVQIQEACQQNDLEALEGPSDSCYLVSPSEAFLGWVQILALKIEGQACLLVVVDVVAEVDEDVALEAYVEAVAVANSVVAKEEKSFVEVVTAAAELAACFVDMLAADYFQEAMDVDQEEEEELLKALKSSVLLEKMNQVMG